MPNVITLRDPGAREYLRRTNTDARLGRLVAAIRRDYYASQAIPERDPSYQLPTGSTVAAVTLEVRHGRSA